MPNETKKVYPQRSRRTNLNLSDETKSFQQRIDEVRSLVEENLRYTKTIKQSTASSQDLKAQKDLQKLLQENLKISHELFEMTKKIKRWVTFQRVWGVVKILIILVPLILASIYLPPLVQKSVEPIRTLYQEFTNLTQGVKQQEALIQQYSDQLNDIQVPK